MAESELSFGPLLANVGLWAGLIITLLIFSLLLGDNTLARLAQHVLVGASLGYATLVTIQYVVNLRIATPLSMGEWRPLVVPMILSLLLLAAGLDRVFAQGRVRASNGRVRRTVQAVGVIPLAILLGVGLAAGAIGLIQGTLIAQTRQVVTSTFASGRIGAPLWTGLLTLLLTSATLLALTLDRRIHIEPLPRPVRPLLQGWVWIGQRALWIASGVLLARLFAARLTLLVERMDYLATTLHTTGLWQWADSLWRSFFS